MSAPFPISVGTSATLLVAGNTGRQGLVIVNTSTTTSVFIGEDDSVTIANGIEIFAQGTLGFDRGFGLYKGPVFAIVAAATNDVRVWEILQLA